MPISVTCSQCGAALNIKEEFAGKRGKCPRCQGTSAVTIAVPAKTPSETASIVHLGWKGGSAAITNAAAPAAAKGPAWANRVRCLMNRCIGLYVRLLKRQRKTPPARGLGGADDGLRTHDLLHGKQTL